VSGNPWVGLKIAGFALVINSVIYYSHERVWNKVNVGRDIPPENVNDIKFYEKVLRSMGKLLTWRILMFVSLFIAAWSASGNPLTGVEFVGWSIVVNTILFYSHERLWNRISWGKEVKEE